MNTEALAKLAANAIAFGKTYAALKDALVKQGIVEAEASRVAREAANLAALIPEETGEACPLCGRGE